MATTTNFGWPTPDDTDLVKNGAAAMRSLGSGIDTSLVKLKGGTTGQILSKASNTDLDYVWIANDQGDITAVTAGTGITGGGTSGAVTITNEMATTIDAKGDLIAGTADNAFARLAVGSNGQTLVADNSQTTGLAWANNFAAGKNKIINGDFGIWQRGTSFTPSSGAWTFNADRFQTYSTWSSGTLTAARQSFTAGNEISGYEGQFFIRHTAPTTGTSNLSFRQLVEDVRTFAGQTITFSFWAKASTGRNVEILIRQNFGSGGSANADTYSSAISIGTTWARYSFTTTLPSISGKTIGTGSALEIWIYTSTNFTGGTTLDYWGWQLEAGSVATAFQTATGTIQGELAACQRYYIRLNDSTSSLLANGNARSTTNTNFLCNLPVSMRTRPTSVDYTSLQISDGVTNYAVTSLTSGIGNQSQQYLDAGVASGLTQFRPMFLQQNGSTGYIAFSAEL